MDLPAQFGKYLLIHRLGVGGMAELFLARQTGLKGFEKVLAIKKILPHLTQDQDFVSMFVNEGKLAALLTHQHIVQIFDLGHVDGAYYLAMEYVMGKDLRTVAARARERTGRVPINQALSIVSQVASGLDYAHRKKDLNGRDLNIVHRDVSPQNVLVSYEGEVKLVDFGIAKAAGIGQETRTGILKGKLAYMSPEQATGKPIDRRSDVFALGIVLYELLTGRRLFKGDSDLSTLEQVRTAQVEPPRRVDADIPEALEAVVLTALARDPAQRYQTAAEFQAALEGIIAERGRAASTIQLSQYMASLFADEQRADNERLQALHHETIRIAIPPRSSSNPTRRPGTSGSRPRSVPPPQPAPARHPVRTALLGAVVLFLLGSSTVIATPSVLTWMRDRPGELARVGAVIEAKLHAAGLSRLVPERPEPRGPQVAALVDPDLVDMSDLPPEAAALAPESEVVAPTASEPQPPGAVALAAQPAPDVKPVDREKVRRLMKRARDLYGEGRLDAVEEVLRGVIEQDPHSPLAYHLLGRVYLERKDEDRALKVLSEAAHQFPQDATLHYDLGFLYAQRGLGPLAREELTRALELQPAGKSAARARLWLSGGPARPDIRAIAPVQSAPLPPVSPAPPVEPGVADAPAIDTQDPLFEEPAEAPASDDVAANKDLLPQGKGTE